MMLIIDYIFTIFLFIYYRILKISKIVNCPKIKNKNMNTKIHLFEIL